MDCYGGNFAAGGDLQDKNSCRYGGCFSGDVIFVLTTNLLVATILIYVQQWWVFLSKGFHLLHLSVGSLKKFEIQKEVPSILLGLSRSEKRYHPSEKDDFSPKKVL